MMEKLGPVNALYPTPTVIVGALVGGKPNFITIGHIGIMTHRHVSLGMNKSHYTNAGIRENKTFGVCLPSESLAVETDYCGTMTGKKADKAALFDVFYGELKTAPMIRQCPVCLECRLDRIIDFSTHDVFVGEIFQTFADESVLSGGKIDIAKLKPLLFDMNSLKYWSLGREVAECWKIGRKLKTGNAEEFDAEGEKFRRRLG